MTDFKSGWIKQDEDERDYTIQHEEIKPFLKLTAIKDLPSKFSLIDKDSPIQDQGEYGSCTAHAGTGIMRFYDKVNYGTFKDFSRLFLYYWSRYIMNGNKKPTEDTGATIRDTMKAMQKYGIALEKNWPYTRANLNKTPSVKVNNEGDDYQVLKYFKLPEKNINRIKQAIYAGTPVMFGSIVYESIMNVGSDGLEPYPGPADPEAGAHARVVEGWDDDIEIPISGTNKTVKGGF